MTAVFNTSYVLEIVDAGATIAVGSGCTSVTPTTARCSLEFTGAATPRAIEVELGDPRIRSGCRRGRTPSWSLVNQRR